MGKIVSIVNRKGGVGKTTLTLGLADTLVGEVDARVDPDPSLMVTVDLDPQASLTRALLSDRERSPANPPHDAGLENKTMAAALNCYLRKSDCSQTEIEQFLIRGVGLTGFPYALLATNSDAWDVERKTLRLKDGESKLKKATRKILSDLAENYQYVLVDCPPGQTIIAEAAIEQSDLVLCPITPDHLSHWGLQSFDDYVRDLAAGEQPIKARFVVTKFKPKTTRGDPQNGIINKVEQYSFNGGYVKMLHEAGGESHAGGGSIKLPFDSKLSQRLEGNPKPSRIWPWSRAFTKATQEELRRLALAVKQELA